MRVILSTNDNNDYLFFTPITAWVWRKFGFSSILFMPYKQYNEGLLNLVLSTGMSCIDQTVFVDVPEGYREDTITQCSRMYAGCLDLHPEEYIMTGDIDMLCLSDYLKPDDESKIHLHGHDLTGYGQYPMCYVGAKVKHWREIMNIKAGNWNEYLQRDLSEFPKAKSDKWEEYWQVDQDILTDRLKRYGADKCESVHRGHSILTGLPVGRVDRHSWAKTLGESVKIDAHLLRPGYTDENFYKILSLLAETFPKENLQWIMDYRTKYLTFL